MKKNGGNVQKKRRGDVGESHSTPGPVEKYHEAISCRWGGARGREWRGVKVQEKSSGWVISRAYKGGSLGLYTE